MQGPCREARQGKQATVGPEGGRRRDSALLTFLAPCPGSEHFLQLPSQALWLPRLSQFPAGLSQSRTIPGLPALPVTKEAGMGVSQEPGCAPPDGDSPALAEKGPIVAQGSVCP